MCRMAFTLLWLLEACDVVLKVSVLAIFLFLLLLGKDVSGASKIHNNIARPVVNAFMSIYMEVKIWNKR